MVNVLNKYRCRKKKFTILELDLIFYFEFSIEKQIQKNAVQVKRGEVDAEDPRKYNISQAVIECFLLT